MNTLTQLTISVSKYAQGVEPIEPDKANVPANVADTVTRLVSGIMWVATAAVFLAAILFLAGAATRPKSRGAYLVSALVAFAIGAFIATPSGRAYVQDIVNNYI